MGERWARRKGGGEYDRMLRLIVTYMLMKKVGLGLEVYLGGCLGGYRGQRVEKLGYDRQRRYTMGKVGRTRGAYEIGVG